MSSKTRSRSLFKVGFDIDPNQLSTNFNKKNQIGFKLKLMENLRNSKRTIEKFEDNMDTIESPSNSKNKDLANDKEDSNSPNKYLERVRFSNKLKQNFSKYTDNLDISDNNIERRITRSKEKRLSNKVVGRSMVNQTALNTNEYDNKVLQNPSNKKKSAELNFTKLISDFDSLVEINTNLSVYVNNECPLDDESKIIDVWIDLENNLNDNKPCKSQLIKLLYIFNRFIKVEKTPFLIDPANKIFYKLLKILITSVISSLFVILYVGYDNNIKSQLKKLINNISKPLFHIYEIFDYKKLYPKASEESYDKFTKFLIKYYKLQKTQIKQSDLMLMITKEVDGAGLAVKQFSK